MHEHARRIINEIECVVLEATISARNRIVAASLGMVSEDCPQGSERVGFGFEEKVNYLIKELEQSENNV